ncbi:2OG-Fe(II) oxygenase [Candidatus Pelagibacter sp.]|jgi:sporadic carbohydrate cluster 2OG-Fe(II) oxygenase|nr:2OG-Fe(II) oxygenase [Candidatus Pelagibacter sp.]
MKFNNKIENKIQNKFLKNGYYIFDIKKKKKLNYIKKEVTKYTLEWLQKKKIKVKLNSKILDNVHKFVQISELNDLRIYIYNKINQKKYFQKLYYELGKEYINIICGNELAMQKKCNLSIQLPKDNSSLLPLHSDVWSGDSEFELVFWLPLVDVYRTKSMFILSPKENEKHFKKIKKLNSIDEVYNKVKKKLKWLKLDYGQGLLFTQNLMHGNIENKESSTRFSFNCRFKAIFSPYRDKKIGSFFNPITIKPITIMGMNYNFLDDK